MAMFHLGSLDDVENRVARELMRVLIKESVGGD